MSMLHLTLDCAPTSKPHEEIKHLTGMANMLGITLGCTINKVWMSIAPGDDAEVMCGFYDRAVTRRGLRPVPTSREG